MVGVMVSVISLVSGFFFHEYYRPQCFSNILMLFCGYTLLLVTLIMNITLLYKVYRLWVTVGLGIV